VLVWRRRRRLDQRHRFWPTTRAIRS